MEKRRERLAFEALFQSGLIWSAHDSSGEESGERRQERFRRSQQLTAPFGIEEIDQEFPGGGLSFSAIHEWISDKEETRSISIISLLVRNAFQKAISDKQEKNHGEWNRFFVWIGEECWPTPFFLAQLFSKKLHQQILKHSLFLRPKSHEDRLWTIDCALRSPASFSIIAFVCRDYESVCPHPSNTDGA